MQIHIFLFLAFIQSFVACQKGTEDVRSLAAGISLQPVATNQQMPQEVLPQVANIVFQSFDEGLTWQDVSTGLPGDIKIREVVVSNGKVFLSAGKGNLFRSIAYAAPVSWNQEQEILQPDNIISIFPGRAGLYAFAERDGLFHKIDGMDLWIPAFSALKGEWIRCVLETGDENLLVGSDHGIFKSADGGKVWKKVFESGSVTNLLATNGILFASCNRGVLRSADSGENWEKVLDKNGMAFITELTEGSVAAILKSNGEPQSKDRLFVSTDSGLSWQSRNLPPSRIILDVVQVDKYLFCSLEGGIFRSTDQGQTWELVFPSEGKFFRLATFGQMIFAVQADAGC